MTRKIDMTVEAVVLLPVKVKLDVTVRADDDAKMDKIIGALESGKYNKKRFDIEEVSVVTAEFHGLLDEDEGLDSQAQEHVETMPQMKVLGYEVDDSR